MHQTLHQILLVAAPKVAGGVLTLGLSIFLLRVWTPEEYGLFSLCATVILLADAILGSSIDLATLRLVPERRIADPASALAMARAALQSKLLAAGLALPLIAIFARPLGRALFHQPGQEALVVMSALATVALLLFRSVLVHAQVEQRFERYALLELLHNGLKFGGIALLLLLTSRPPPLAVLKLYFVGPLSAFAAGLALFRRPPLWSARIEWRSMAEIFRYVKWYALSGGLGNVIGRVDMFMLSALASMREVGLFAGGQTFAMVLWLAASYLSVVLSPRIMPHINAGTCRPFYRRVQLVLWGLAGLILAGAFIVLQSALLLLFPAAFRESAGILLILLIGHALSFATFPVALPLVMFLRPRFILAMDCVALPVLVVVYWIVVARRGAVGAAWVTTAALILRGGIVQIAAWQLSGGPPSPARAEMEERLRVEPLG